MRTRLRRPFRDQGLVGLGDAQLPGQARILDGGAGGCTGAAVVTGDKDDLRAALGNTGGNGADTGLADQLHVDVGVAVGVLQVIDQLGQILDGVDVVVGAGGEIRPTPVVLWRVLAIQG